MKAGQKVIVLKSPKGICLQLESGKVIAIRASVKGGQQGPGVEHKLGSFPLQDSSLGSNSAPKFPPRNDGDVIDISNDDEDDGDKTTLPASNSSSHGIANTSQPIIKPSSLDASNVSSSSSNLKEPTADKVYKEKVVYKPNLVHRKPPSHDSQHLKSFDSGVYHSQPKPPSTHWDGQKNLPSTASNFYNRDNGYSKGFAAPSRNCK